MKYIASVSFGKDSLAMLLLLIEKKYNIDEVIFYDTGMEFQAIYNIRDKVKELLNEKNIKYTELKPQNDFEYDMLEREISKRDGTTQKGYSWCGGRCRWGTTFKNQTIKKYYKEKYENETIVEYIGIAIDEKDRISRDKKTDTIKIYPLAEWGMTENDCLVYCYKHDFNWEEDGVDLYTILDRVSCWCCGNKNLKELKNIYEKLPNYWEKLKTLQSKTDRTFRDDMSIFDLENRFKEV